jgi:hypothetical protein
MLGANVRDRHLPDVEPLGDTDDPLLAFVPIARVGASHPTKRYVVPSSRTAHRLWRGVKALVVRSSPSRVEEHEKLPGAATKIRPGQEMSHTGESVSSNQETWYVDPTLPIRGSKLAESFSDARKKVTIQHLSSY